MAGSTELFRTWTQAELEAALSQVQRVVADLPVPQMGGVSSRIDSVDVEASLLEDAEDPSILLVVVLGLADDFGIEEWPSEEVQALKRQLAERLEALDTPRWSTHVMTTASRFAA